MNMYHRIILILNLCLALSKVFSQDTPTIAPEIKGLTLAPDKLGSVANSVNLFTGDLTLPISLVSIPGKEGLDVNVGIVYNSSVQNVVDTWNLDAPTGILGLGWNMDVPKIVVDHKNTGTREDDTFFLVEGGTSNRLIRTGSGSDGIGLFNTYQAKNYQFWQIKFYYEPMDYGQSGSGANKWVIVRENGFKYVYGDKNSGRSTIQYVVRWGNWVGNSSQTLGQSQMASAWNLSEVNNLWGEKVTFEYNNIEQSLGYLGQKQTEASYLKQIVDPVGRKVQFYYNNKAPQFYMEPHTEQAEPDAYQEVYEKQYLDHIDVLQETGIKYLSVNLRYTSINDGTNTAKMLLSYIEQRNNLNQSLPGVRFDYYNSTGVSGYKGFLQKITYPSGATVSYTYAMTNNSIGHSNRGLTISAPSNSNEPNGYAEPKVWIGGDYVVVAWRGLGSGGAHDGSPHTVVLEVYQWVGEWKYFQAQSIWDVSLAGNNNPALDYKDFQVTLEDNFFAVLSHPTGTSYVLVLYSKDESKRGGWVVNNFGTVDYGNGGLPTLMSGNNFVAVGSPQNDSTHPSHLYTFVNSWKDDTFVQDAGMHYYTGTNNYFISHNQDSDPSPFTSNPEIGFTYLSEEKKWTTKNWPSSVLFSTSGASYWYSSNSMAVIMAGGQPEYAYRWDLAFNPIWDTQDVNNNSLFGSIVDTKPVFIYNSSMVGIDGRMARFDGQYWRTDNIISTHNSPFGFYFSYGEDVIVRPIEYVSSTINYKGGRKVFNPNTLAWQPDYVMDGADRGIDYANVGINYYYFGNGYYYRQPNGSWPKILNFTQGLYSKGGYPQFEAWAANTSPYQINDVVLFKNGLANLSTNLQSYHMLFGDNGRFNNHGISNQTIVSFPSGNDQYLTQTLQLNRVLNGLVDGPQTDYPVTSITVSAANSVDQSTSIEYVFSTASIDPTGNVAQYAEVNVIPGSNSISNKPNGYTKTFFNNGLDHYRDDSNIPVVSGVTIDLRWSGQPYLAKVYDFPGNIVSMNTIYYTVVIKAINNSVGTMVDKGYYVRPSSVNKNVDGIEVVTSYTYDTNSGLVRSELRNNSSGTQIPEESDYIYWYEKYDPTQSLNLLTPAVQVTRLVNSSITESQVTRYKNWSALNLGGSATAPAVFDQLTWKGTNSSSFTSWDATIASGSLTDWTLSQQISVRDTYTGTPLETLTKGNLSSAVILDQYKIRPLAKVANANFNQVAFSSFEDNSKGNWGWMDGTIVAGTSKTGNSYMNIGTTGITMSGLSSSEKYTLSFWAKSTSGFLNADGVGAINLGTLSAWTYQEYTVTGLSSLNLKLTGGSVSIDELRLYPTKASMSTGTYDLVYGPTSQTDNNNRVVYTQYDAWGRPQSLLDENLNIIKSYTYNTKK